MERMYLDDGLEVGALLGQRHHAEGSQDVHLDGHVQLLHEVHGGGEVDDDVAVLGDVLGVLGGEAQAVLKDVTGNGVDLLHAAVPLGLTNVLDQRGEAGGRQDFLLEALHGSLVLLGANQHVDVLEVLELLHELEEQHLPDESGDAGEEDALAFE